MSELTRAEVDHKNVRRYQQISLAYLETFKQSTMQESTASAGLDQLDMGEGVEAQLLQSLMGGGDRNDKDLDNMMSLLCGGQGSPAKNGENQLQALFKSLS